MELKTLFSEGKIGNVRIKNRIIRSATYESRATEDGYVTDQLIEFYDELAKGGTGLIITGASAVQASGAGLIRMIHLHNDSYIAGQKKLVMKIHDYSEVKVSAQLVHMGSQVTHSKYDIVGPSPLRDPVSKRVARELKTKEVKEIIKSFVKAGLRVYESGYDMVQLHTGHGYLLSDFISPFSNNRTDEYGGNTQKRMKILVDIYDQLRDEVGKNFPITIKLNIRDYLRRGLTFEEGKEIAKKLADLGYDAIEPTSGRVNFKVSGNKSFPNVVITSPEEENYFLPYVKDLKSIIKNCSLILMGGIKNPLSAEKFLQEGIADFVSISRPLIYEPDLPNRWKNGDISPALCTSCTACLGSGLRGPVHCIVKRKLERKSIKKK